MTPPAPQTGYAPINGLQMYYISKATVYRYRAPGDRGPAAPTPPGAPSGLCAVPPQS